MTKEEHKARHKELHESLDELAADFIKATGNLPSKTSILDLMNWSNNQTDLPETTHDEGGS